MAINKIVYNGNTLIDLTGDTVTEETLEQGVTAHNAAGEQIVGTKEKLNIIENVSVPLDFSKGNQSISAGDGNVVKTAIILKPSTLIPANIVKDVEIAGIVGTAETGGDVVVTPGEVASIDFSKLSEGTFEETLKSGTVITYTVTETDGQVTSISNGNNTVTVEWGS